jgi:hypothetical protein
MHTGHRFEEDELVKTTLVNRLRQDTWAVMMSQTSKHAKTAIEFRSPAQKGWYRCSAHGK